MVRLMFALFALVACVGATATGKTRRVIKGEGAKLHPRMTAALAAYKASKPTTPLGKLGGGVECDSCIDFADDGLNALIKALTGVIPSSCSDLCSAALGTSTEAEICDVLCTVVGLGEFVNLLSNTDISPIWFCMEVYACPVTTCKQDCVQIRNLGVTPTTAGPPGKFTYNYVLMFAQGVGTVSTLIGMQGPTADAQWGSDNGALIIGPTASTPYPVSLDASLEISGGQGFPDECPDPGNYNSTAFVCLGDCDDNFKISGPIIGQFTGAPVTITAGDNCNGGNQKAFRRRH